MMGINILLKFAMRSVGINKFPPPLVGMFIFFASMVSMEEKDAAKFVNFFEPANVLLTNFLPVFFSPGLIRTPAAARGVKLWDFVKFVTIISGGLVAIIFQTGLLTDFVMKIAKVMSLA